ncbi:hypothetical protein [Sphingomonas sp. Y38-1Y]|jgi:hypothetical protein|uniref:hypothetical protein n=1 Tax=Sphingomonas sp. Y38-1Y TaxID=3078265 RepID=UPI0028EFE36D|nr:hypothetical protein [Sphingomonas sp. Y38-1Y]
MSIEAIAAQAASPEMVGAKSFDIAPAMPQQVGPQAAAQFENAMAAQQAQRVGGSSDVPPAVKDLLSTLDKVNTEAKSVSDYARTAESSGGELTPGEIVELTMRCQEFMFHCQLTSNIANRSSDGVQQLFRQQS